MLTVVNRHHDLTAAQRHELATASQPNTDPTKHVILVYIGRGTPLGNYTGAGLSRTAALKAYQEVIDGDHPPELAAALNVLRQWHNAGKDVRLVCSCAPLPCHGNIIAHYLESHP